MYVYSARCPHKLKVNDIRTIESTKTRTKNLTPETWTYIETIHLSFACWILAEGRGHQSVVSLVTFVFVLYVALKKRIYSKIRTICLVLSA